MRETPSGVEAVGFCYGGGGIGGSGKGWQGGFPVLPQSRAGREANVGPRAARDVCASKSKGSERIPARWQRGSVQPCPVRYRVIFGLLARKRSCCYFPECFSLAEDDRK